MYRPEGTGKRIGYQIVITHRARQEIKKLTSKVQKNIYNKIKWLGENADVIVHQMMSSLPDDLKGLSRYRVGDWRILYWVYHNERRIVIYGIGHRSDVYKKLKK